jgi:hypothetical protein
MVTSSHTLSGFRSQREPPHLILSRSYIFGIRPDSSNPRIVLGDTFMQGFYTIFDRALGRIGFAVPNAEECNRCTRDAFPFFFFLRGIGTCVACTLSHACSTATFTSSSAAARTRYIFLAKDFCQTVSLTLE